VLLDQANPELMAKAVVDTRPDAIVLHVYRDRVRDALALVHVLGKIAPDVFVLWSGWTAHAPYLQAVSEATLPIDHPRLVVVCGEVEVAFPSLLGKLSEGVIDPQELIGSERSTAWFDVRKGCWLGHGEFAQVADVTSLSAVWDSPTPMSVHPGGAGWIEVSRGCKYACGFCVACAMASGSVRPHLPNRIRSEVAAAGAGGVKLFGLLAAAINYDLESLRALSESIRDLPDRGRRVAGTVHAKFAHGERLELMASLDWETMIVGLQTTTAEAQRLMQRREEREAFATAVDRIAGFCVPEVELILGLPGDGPAGFEQSVLFALSLPVSVSIYRLRLDPWSQFLEQRVALGLQADFANSGRVRGLRGFAEDEVDAAESWLKGLARAPWQHRAKRLIVDGTTVYPSRR
jgi:hypothetical protein